MALCQNAMLEDGSPGELEAAVGDITQAFGVGNVYADALLSDERTFTIDDLLRVTCAPGPTRTARPQQSDLSSSGLRQRHAVLPLVLAAAVLV